MTIAMDVSLLTAANLNQDVDDIISEATHQPFISNAAISLDTLVEQQGEKEQADKDSSGLLCIPVGSDRGMSELLKEKEDEAGMTNTVGGEDIPENLHEEDVVQREDKEVVKMVDDGGGRGKDKMEKGVIPTASEMTNDPYGSRVRKTMHILTWNLQTRSPIFTRWRLRIPYNIKDYLDVMIGSATRVAWKAMDRIPQKHELALLCRNVAENKCLKQEHTIVKGDFETSIAVSNNLSETIKNVEADIKMVTEENQKLEKENEEMKVENEGLKSDKATL
ncbi:hypothetical protein Dimus_012972 [Dionaea muscipula]